ncbi:hypothetical protein SAMN05421837_11871 [Amycolatopsis pretoriensis]|uniref:Uncharacterized protein n=1 Tax=Amycolatopsis pretoriensis TaxID=218821 RepID=A0A1H5RII6_9PSEU|nr:hypothetical protein [Amycolatopsis pretoriensis]SEF38120.1 hypothetical protein SAMN05421837_11871 [Amycolatopsis pretoriensis]
MNNNASREQAEHRDGRSVRSSSRPTATVLRSPSTNHPRIHALHGPTFDATGVCAPACGSADSRRDVIAAAQSRNPQYRDTSAAVTCENPSCSNRTAGTAEDATKHPEPPCP